MVNKLEKPTEKKLARAAGKHTHNGVARSLSLKFVSPERPGVPDRIFVRPIPPEHREIVARYFRLREIKAPGKKPRPLQEREIAWWRDLGFDVDYTDDPDCGVFDD